MKRTLLILGCLLVGGSCAVSEDEPPVVRYGSERRSERWLETEEGTRVGVDEGAEWRGTAVYLSLTSQLLAVEPENERLLWSRDVSGFWNGFTFEQVKDAAGRELWAVKLLSDRPSNEGGELVEYHDLESGDLISLSGEAAKAGTIETTRLWTGDASALAEPLEAWIESADEWQRMRERLFGPPDPLPPDLPAEPERVPARTPSPPEGIGSAIDFESQRVIVIARGDSWNSSGYDLEETLEDDEKVLLRIDDISFQTIGPDGGGVFVRPWLVLVIPKPGARAVIVERDVQNYIGAPPIWKEIVRFRSR